MLSLRSLPDRFLPHGLLGRSSTCGLSGCHAAALASLMLKLTILWALLTVSRQEGGFQLARILLQAVHRATIRLAGLGVLAEVVLQARLQLLQAVLVLHGRLLVVLPALPSLRLGHGDVRGLACFAPSDAAAAASTCKPCPMPDSIAGCQAGPHLSPPRLDPMHVRANRHTTPTAPPQTAPQAHLELPAAAYAPP